MNKPDKVQQFMDKLKQPNGNSNLLINTTKTDFNRYANVWIFKISQCRKCGAQTKTNGIVVFESLTELVVFAEAEHDKNVVNTGMICAEADLLIAYDNGFMLTTSLSKRTVG